MPKYDYHCSACDTTFEVEQKISDPQLTECRECGSGQIERLISGGVGMIMKDGGVSLPDAPPSCQQCGVGPGEACPYS